MAFDFQGTQVYDAAFVKEKAPSYFAGCSATILKIVEKKDIPIDQYFFASYSKVNGWKLLSHDSTYKARKLLITKEWVDENVPGFGNAKAAKLDLQPLPPLLNLEEDEKFKNADGKVIDITVRGERHPDKIYFRGTDIGEMLGINDIRSTLTKATSSFVVGVHYQYFNRLYRDNVPLTTIKNAATGRPDVIYLTYWGYTKLLFTSRVDTAMQYQQWAINVLFKAQLGTADQKQELAADVLGLTPSAIKAFLDTSVTAMPAIYLFTLGKVKDLRHTLNIPSHYNDTDTVVKYGLTNDLRRRTSEQEKSLGKLENVELALTYHVYIDPLHLNAAETEIKHYFKDTDWHMKHPKHTELACVPTKMMTTVLHNEFKRLGNAYAGKLQDLQTQITNVEKINAQLKTHIDTYEEHIKQLREDHGIRIKELRQDHAERLKERDEMMAMLKRFMERS